MRYTRERACSRASEREGEGERDAWARRTAVNSLLPTPSATAGSWLATQQTKMLFEYDQRVAIEWVY